MTTISTPTTYQLLNGKTRVSFDPKTLPKLKPFAYELRCSCCSEKVNIDAQYINPKDIWVSGGRMWIHFKCFGCDCDHIHEVLTIHQRPEDFCPTFVMS